MQQRKLRIAMQEDAKQEKIEKLKKRLSELHSLTQREQEKAGRQPAAVEGRTEQVGVVVAGLRASSPMPAASGPSQGHERGRRKRVAPLPRWTSGGCTCRWRLQPRTGWQFTLRAQRRADHQDHVLHQVSRHAGR